MPRFALLFTLLLTLAPRPLAAAEPQLPTGPAREPIAVDHFPDRLHAVVFRNWRLVPTSILARTLGATEPQLQAMAASMGLPPAGLVPDDLRRRAYITILRRNWHLLPYEQLMELTGMSAPELSVALREDDFLFIKFGNVKPRTPKLLYAEPDEAARKRAAQIRALLQAELGPALANPGEPRFAFVEKLSAIPEGFTPPARKPGEAPRYVYSYFGSFGDPLADNAPESYPDGLLARLAARGVNGVWLHVVLRQIAPGGPHFPEFGEGHAMRLANLRKLVDRCKKFNIDVYLYMNEPRAMHESFFATRPELKTLAGARSGDHLALCTSEPRVRQWLEDSLAHVFKQTPGLGGVFTITASENFTSCASHNLMARCPRCKLRTAPQIIAEVNATIAAGVHRGNPDAKVIAWDWGWNNHGNAADHIALLPKDVWFMSVSEWSLPIKRGGIASTIGEYSISAPGPGPRATAHWKLAQARGLKTLAKVQLNNTWELSSVPYLPAMNLVAEHLSGLARAKVDGLQLSWSLGGYPSPNLQLARYFAENPTATIDQSLDALAIDRFGAANVPAARKAWKSISDGMREYPYSGATVYNGPQQHGPANLLHFKPTGYGSTMVGLPYDDLNGWRAIYPADIFADQFAKVAAGWMAGAQMLQEIDHPAARDEALITRAAAIHFQSVANQSRFIMARQAGDKAKMIDLARQEAALARTLLDITLLDSRIGFEASNHYYYVPQDLMEKVINCHWVMQKAAGM